jgi:hypothetical protein
MEGREKEGRRGQKYCIILAETVGMTTNFSKFWVSHM